MNSHLITSHHLEREAIIYVRQSSDRQVRSHLESRQRQRSLYQRAEELGWSKSRIVVLEEQKGCTGSSRHGRRSYQNLSDRVIQQRAGIILAVDIDRWARDNADWQLLLRDCVFENVLLSNEHRLFNPRDPDDRMLLGIQGALAEYELSVIRARTSTCWWNKAQRHEMFTAIPTGFVQTETGLVQHPNRRVRHSVKRLFEKFNEFSSVLQLCRWYVKHNEQLPYVAHGDDALHVQWRPATYGRLLNILKNPAYAGAYVLGRRETVEIRNELRERVRQRRNVPRERWKVVAQDKFEGYITWQQYEQNMAKIEKNRRGGDGHGESRHGASLLSGLLRCAHCGASLHVTYHHSGPSYVCRGGARQRERGKQCLSFSGQTVEPLFSEMMLEALRPAGLSATCQAETQLREHLQRDRQVLVDQLQQLEYEAERARRQYDRVEPEHRLVAEDLERRWNETLQAVTAQRDRLQQYDQTHVRREWDDSLTSWFTENRLEEVWYAESTSVRMKKQIVDMLVREVIVSLSDTRTEVELCIHWQGGYHTFFSAPRRHRKASPQNEAKQVVSLLRRVSDDASIARILNRHGIHMPATSKATSTTWTARSVRAFREHHAIATFDPEEKKRQGLMTAEEAARQLKISAMSVHRLIAAHILPAEQSQPGLPVIIRASDLSLSRVQEATHRILASLPRPLTENPNQKKLF